MHYFPQRSVTDCLLACVETLVGQPRENIPPDLIEWIEATTNNRYLNYSSVGNILNFFNRFCFLKISPDFYFIELNDEPSIVGITTKGYNSLHSMIWDGSRLYDPWYEEFIPYNEKVKISYLISTNYNPYQQQPYIANGYFKLFDKNILKNNTDISGKFIEKRERNEDLPELPYIKNVFVNNQFKYEENH